LDIYKRVHFKNQDGKIEREKAMEKKYIHDHSDKRNNRDMIK
jgi:hypothetical protein